MGSCQNCINDIDSKFEHIFQINMQSESLEQNSEGLIDFEENEENEETREEVSEDLLQKLEDQSNMIQIKAHTQKIGYKSFESKELEINQYRSLNYLLFDVLNIEFPTRIYLRGKLIQREMYNQQLVELNIQTKANLIVLPDLDTLQKEKQIQNGGLQIQKDLIPSINVHQRKLSLSHSIQDSRQIRRKNRIFYKSSGNNNIINLIIIMKEQQYNIQINEEQNVNQLVSLLVKQENLPGNQKIMYIFNKNNNLILKDFNESIKDLNIKSNTILEIFTKNSGNKTEKEKNSNLYLSNNIIYSQFERKVAISQQQQQKQSFELCVQSFCGKKIFFLVNEDLKVFEFKEMIKQRENIPRMQQKLVFQKQTLNDTCSFKDYKIGKQDVIYMVLSLKNTML